MSRRRDSENSKVNRYADGSSRFWAAVAVFVFAATIRFIYLAQSSDAPTFDVPIVDAGTYDTIARSFISGKAPADIFWQPVFYPLWLAAIYKTGGGILTAKILQVFVGSFTCVMAFLLGDRFLGRKGGLLVGASAALYMPMVFLECELLGTAWEGFWFVALALLSLRARERMRPLMCFVLGLCIAIAALTRPNFIPVGAVWWLWLVWSWYRGKAGLKMVFPVVCGAVGFAVLTLPVAGWSYKTMGRFSFLPHSGGLNLYIGNNPDWQHAVTIRPGTEWRRLTELPADEGIKTKTGAEEWFYRKFREYVTSEPLSFVEGLGTKTVQFLSSRQLPRNVDIYQYRQWSSLLATGVWKTGRFGFPFGLLFPLALVGGWYWRRSIPAILWIVVAAYATSIIVVFVAGRYRAPLGSFLCISAAGGLLAFAEMIRQKLWLKAAAAVLAVPVMATAMSIAGPFPQEKSDYRSEMYFELGNSLRDRSRLSDAEKAYTRAIQLRPDYADAHADLAAILKDRKAAREAVEHYEAAIGSGLDTGLIRQGLGEALVQEHRFDEAIAQFRAAIELSPDSSTARNNLGNLLAMKGDYIAAIPQFEEALKLAPDNPRTMNNLANALAGAGRLARAEEMYRRSIAADPTNAGTHYNLAVCLRLQGKTEEAAKELVETLRLDPNHAQARTALRSLGRSQ